MVEDNCFLPVSYGDWIVMDVESRKKGAVDDYLRTLRKGTGSRISSEKNRIMKIIINSAGYRMDL